MKDTENNYEPVLIENTGLGKGIAVYEDFIPTIDSDILGITKYIEELFKTPPRAAALRTLNSKRSGKWGNSQTKIADEFLRAIFDTVPSGVSIAADSTCRVIRHNPVAAEFLRIKPWENFSISANKPLVKVYHQGGEMGPEELPIQRAAWKGEVVRGQELELVWEDGVRKFAIFNANPLFGQSGEIIGVISTFAETTEHRKSEEKVQLKNAVLNGINRIFNEALTCENEETLGKVCLNVAQELTRSRFGFIGELNPDGFLNIVVSDAGMDACAAAPESGRLVYDKYFKAHGIYGQVMLDGKTLFANDLDSHPDRTGLPEGHPPVRAFLGAPLIQSGRVIGMIGLGKPEGGYGHQEAETLESLTTAMVQALMRKRSEDALRESEERYRVLAQKLQEVELPRAEERFYKAFHYNPSMMSIINLEDGRYIDINDAWTSTLGFTREEVIGYTPEELGLYDDSKQQTKIMRELKDKGFCTMEADYRSRSGDGLIILISDHIININNKPCILGCAVDITERRRKEEARLKNEVNKVKRETEIKLEKFKKVVTHSIGLENIHFISPEMKSIYEIAMKHHKKRSMPVLIQGETGTGKDVIAKIIHFGSLDDTKPFIDINCAAISPTLFESELFGYEPGAFTGGLSKGQKGKFDLARGGTLFLDEIAEIPIDLQAKLLRVIEEKMFYRVGGLSKIHTDVRIICATNLDLEKRVAEGAFRKDLYYRLKVGGINIPPLRKRPQEIVPLASAFLTSCAQKAGKRFQHIGEAAAEILVRYQWPGNVRELKNAMEWVTFMYDDTELRPEHLEVLEYNELLQCGSGEQKGKNEFFMLDGENLNLNDYIGIIIANTLRKNGGNVKQAALQLGISRAYIYKNFRHVLP
ncbi:MAG: sigma 54-interacting transcriptional regulator [Firmicutes bacterium]|nr:sigma 54-interacting transcriptional regulator [Bacillota bacterium]